MRRLVVNGDDFGLTPGVNAGILDAHARGILTSVSLFANAGATDEAIDLVRRTPTLGVGCHLTLADGVPTASLSDLPTLAPDGAFRPTWGLFVRDVMLGRIQLREIEHELTAQVQRLVIEGIRLTHLDSHKHVHAYPPIFRIVVRLARQFGIRTVRVPCEAGPLGVLRRSIAVAGAGRQAIENLALVPWAARDRAMLEAHALRPAPRFVGRALTGLFTPSSLRALLEALPQGTSELMMHPGYPDDALARVRTRLREARAREVALLTDPATIDLVERAGIVLSRHGSAGAFPEQESHV